MRKLENAKKKKNSGLMNQSLLGKDCGKSKGEKSDQNKMCSSIEKRMNSRFYCLPNDQSD